MKTYVVKKIKQLIEVESFLNEMDDKGYFLRDSDIKEGIYIFELYPHVAPKEEPKPKAKKKTKAKAPVVEPVQEETVQVEQNDVRY